MNEQLLANIFWHALTGPQARFAAGSGGARRYVRGSSPIFAFAESTSADFAALTAHCAPDEALYCADWSGRLPSGWRLDAEAKMYRMVWDAPLPTADAMPEAVRLSEQHVSQALELTALTHPGPFRPTTLELGEYFGVFDEHQRLIAMAGERAHAGTLREISGVCTHPDHQGRGLARRLMIQLIRRQLQRGETPFLHVMCSNLAAHGLYLRMGFRDHQETPVRVVALTG